MIPRKWKGSVCDSRRALTEPQSIGCLLMQVNSSTAPRSLRPLTKGYNIGWLALRRSLRACCSCPSAHLARLSRSVPFVASAPRDCRKRHDALLSAMQEPMPTIGGEDVVLGFVGTSLATQASNLLTISKGSQEQNVASRNDRALPTSNSLRVLMRRAALPSCEGTSTRYAGCR